MRDGVRIAIDVWLPESLSAGEKVPTVMRATRYWRAQDRKGPPPEGKSAIQGADDRYRRDLREIQLFSGAGYAQVLVDARGSGAWFGIRRFELAEDEWRDYGEIAAWIVNQPWSNGRVGAYRRLLRPGNTAEMLAANRHAAVKAVAPLFNDFDNFGHLVFPGGLLNVGFLRDWSRVVHHLDSERPLGLGKPRRRALRAARDRFPVWGEARRRGLNRQAPGRCRRRACLKHPAVRGSARL